jgi:lipopolysaccharide heptosyltransferase II
MMTILLVRPRLIGDVILTTPAIRALRRRFRDARILYLVEALAAPVVEANPHVSATLVIRHRRGWRRWREDLDLARRLRAERVDVAVDLHGGPRSGWLTWATRAPVRVGYDVSGRRWMYTHRIPRPRGYAPRHSVLNQWDLLAPVDPALAVPLDPARDRVEMPVAAGAREAVRARLLALGASEKDEIVVVHAGAGNEFRRWPAASFARVAAALAVDRRDRRILILADASERALASEIVETAQAASGAAGRIAPAAGWPLADVRALLERAALFVGGDSGPMHMAATSDVPIVALFGPTLPVHWTPWRPAALPTAIVEPGPLSCRPCDQRVCGPGDYRCLRQTGPDQVVAAARRLLERT